MISTGCQIVFPQWILGFAVSILQLQLGLLVGWTSPTLAWLNSPNSTISATPEEISWVAALLNLGRFFGAFTGSLSMYYIGSKQTIFITLIPIAIGWCLVALADSIAWLYVARFLSGIGIGMLFSSFSFFVGEVSMREIRGALISTAGIGQPIGQLVANTCGSYLSITTSACIYLSSTLFLMALFFWLPDSPHHLIKVENRVGAKKSINWYRGGKGVDTEFDEVEMFVDANISTSFAKQLLRFKSPAIRRALFLTITLGVFMQICGLDSIIFYMEIILQRAKVTIIKPSEIVIYVSTCGILATILATSAIDRYGRRFLLIVSSIGITACMFGLMSYFLILNTHVNVMNLQWLPVTSMFLLLISYYIGLIPVPNTMLGELFPADVKCIASCISGLIASIASFLSAKSYQSMVELMGDPWVFAVHAIYSIAVLPYTIFFVIETKGKSLQQIQDELTKR